MSRSTADPLLPPLQSARLRQDGQDIRTERMRVGRSDVSATVIHTHGLELAGVAVRSPLDARVPA